MTQTEDIIVQRQTARKCSPTQVLTAHMIRVMKNFWQFNYKKNMKLKNIHTRSCTTVQLTTVLRHSMMVYSLQHISKHMIEKVHNIAPNTILSNFLQVCILIITNVFKSDYTGRFSKKRTEPHRCHEWTYVNICYWKLLLLTHNAAIYTIYPQNMYIVGWNTLSQEIHLSANSRVCYYCAHYHMSVVWKYTHLINCTSHVIAEIQYYEHTYIFQMYQCTSISLLFNNATTYCKLSQQNKRYWKFKIPCLSYHIIM